MKKTEISLDMSSLPLEHKALIYSSAVQHLKGPSNHDPASGIRATCAGSFIPAPTPRQRGALPLGVLNVHQTWPTGLCSYEQGDDVLWQGLPTTADPEVGSVNHHSLMAPVTACYQTFLRLPPCQLSEQHNQALYPMGSVAGLHLAGLPTGPGQKEDTWSLQHKYGHEQC